MNREPEYKPTKSAQTILLERIAAALEKIADKLVEKVSNDKYKGNTGGLF